MNRIVCYKKNNKYIPLSRENKNLCRDEKVFPVYETSGTGRFILQNSLILLTEFIIDNIFAKGSLYVEHAINGGLFCEIHTSKKISLKNVSLMNKILNEIIIKNEPMYVEYMSKDKLMKEFKDDNAKYELIKNSLMDGAYFCIYNEIKDYFFTPVVSYTGILKGAYLKYFKPGIIIFDSSEDEKSNQKKLFNIYSESNKWAKILSWEKIEMLNKSIDNGEINHLIHVAEALHEKKIVDIAHSINSKKNKLKLISISGPSSSGKTTFLQRLTVQLRVLGISVMGISLDNYFINRDKTPLDGDGNPDYESINSIDIKLFNQNLKDLIELKEVELPIFDFQTGMRSDGTLKKRIDKNTIIIIEGIHGLNEKLTEDIKKENKLKIYVSALTQINIDNTHYISTSDNRLIRRIVRDYLFRNHPASKTFEMWRNVRKGEEKYIFPFQEESDFMFNSSLLYELSALKHFTEPLLNEIDESKPYYMDAKRLLFILSFFKSISIEMIPHTSVIREFIGGSSFDY